MQFSFEHPLFLLLLPLVLCFVICKKSTASRYLPRLDWIPKKERLININTLLKIAISTLAIFALSSPFTYASISPSQKFGRAIVLALDSSGSMRESGFSKIEDSKSKFELLQTDHACSGHAVCHEPPFRSADGNTNWCDVNDFRYGKMLPLMNQIYEQ